MLGIICGGGNYPKLVAKACSQHGYDFCLLFVGEYKQKAFVNVPVLSVNFGEVQRMLDFFRENKVEKVVFAGSMKRPDFSKLNLDQKGKSWLLKLGKSILKGDDGFLRSLESLFNEEGFEVVAGTDLLKDVFLNAGVYSNIKPSEKDLRDIEIGFWAAKKLGEQDVGQGVIVFNGSVLCREDSEGTDKLIERAAKERKSGGALVKVCKPQQDVRFDLPTVGPETIEKLHQHDFSGLAIEAGKCIVIDKERMTELANRYNMFFTSFNPEDRIKIFISAGEASGDYLGGQLMHDLRAIIRNKSVEFYGIGGQNMCANGLKLLFPISELSIIGIWEVLNKVLHVKRLIDRTFKAILEYRPDIVITIDSSGFNHRVNKKLKSHNFKKPIVHYVAPPIWAWRKWRVKSFHNFIDKLMVLLPFEKDVFCKYGIDTIFTGHPIAIDSDFNTPSDARLQNFRKAHKLNSEEELIITILPGSRKSELEQHIPILRDFVRLMKKRHDNLRVIIPTLPEFKDIICKKTDGFAVKPVILTTKSEKILAYYSSKLAIAASGTVTLELARVGLPSITIYKTSPVTYRIVKFLIQVTHVSLVNIIEEKEVIPELLQDACTAENILECVELLLSKNSNIVEIQKKCYTDVMEKLYADKFTAAREIISLIEKK